MASFDSPYRRYLAMTTDSHDQDRYANTHSDAGLESIRSARDVLPPVEPPAASFLMQLFVTPMIIVALIVSVWFLVAWAASPSSDVDSLVKGVESMNHRSWHQAHGLANRLRDPDSAAVRKDATIATRLCQLLERQVEAANPTDEQRTMQIYLCRALGEFEVPDPLPTLEKVAFREKVDASVRRGALQAIGVLASNLPEGDVAEHTSFIESLIEAAAAEAKGSGQDAMSVEEAGRFRSTAIFVLGLIGGDQAEAALQELLSDSDENARGNAAIALARLGNPACLAPLKAMLTTRADDVDASDSAMAADGNASIAAEKALLLKNAQWKRELILSAALRAIATLRVRHPDFDTSPFRDGVAALSEEASLSPAVRQEAREVRRLLDESVLTPTTSSGRDSDDSKG